VATLIEGHVWDLVSPSSAVPWLGLEQYQLQLITDVHGQVCAEVNVGFQFEALLIKGNI